MFGRAGLLCGLFGILVMLAGSGYGQDVVAVAVAMVVVAGATLVWWR